MFVRAPVAQLLGLLLLLAPGRLSAQPPATGTLRILVTEPMGPVDGALLRSDTVSVTTDAEGRARMVLRAGRRVITVARIGYVAKRVTVDVPADSTIDLVIEVAMTDGMGMPMAMVEDLTVTATRTPRLAGETPIRVEVITPDEVAMRTDMSPGGITMLLNETNGLRVRTISTSLGTGAVRIQGLPGQFTALLSDGLPLYGGASSSLGPLAITPVDLGHVEVIKGAASALYGGQALGGMIDLVSRPVSDPAQLLLNQTSRAVTNVSAWSGWKLGLQGGLSVVASGTRQGVQDLDDDGWSEQPEMTQWALRPRFTRTTPDGDDLLATVGVGVDDREGGTLPGRLAPDGSPFPEGLVNRHGDVGFRGTWNTAGAITLGTRVALVANQRERTFGPGPVEEDRLSTGYAEFSAGRIVEAGAWLVGASIQDDRYANELNGAFDRDWWTPGIFASVDRRTGPVTTSLSARWDHHPQAGDVVTGRLAFLVRPAEEWTIRLSGGTGYAPGTPQIEEVEAIGLRSILPAPLAAERSSGVTLDLSGQVGKTRLLLTAFASEVRDPVQLADAGDTTSATVLRNAAGPTRTTGMEANAVWRSGGLTLIGSYIYTYSTRAEPEGGTRGEVPYTPRHRVAVDGMYERPGKYRLGVELFWYGPQRLFDDPYLERSPSYFDLCVLAVRTLGSVDLIFNVNNALDVRQFEHEPTIRASPGMGGTWRVDAWGPMDGVVGNVAVRWRW